MATRYDKTAVSYAACVAIAASLDCHWRYLRETDIPATSAASPGNKAQHISACLLGLNPRSRRKDGSWLNPIEMLGPLCPIEPRPDHRPMHICINGRGPLRRIVFSQICNVWCRGWPRLSHDWATAQR